MLKLMFITNNPEVAKLAEKAGVDWIFIDLEFIGKEERQHSNNSVRHHSIKDISLVKSAVQSSEILVRVNPIHDSYDNYPSTEDEINAVIDAGADIVMLPYFHTADEVRRFIHAVGGRVKTCLLLETKESVSALDDILEVEGIDMIHLGINDIHLDLNMRFMFEVLSSGLVEKCFKKIQSKGIPCGFGGIAGANSGLIPGSMIIKEHYRLNSDMVILGRSFCIPDSFNSLEEVDRFLCDGIGEIRAVERECLTASREYFEHNRIQVNDCINSISARQ